MDYAQTINYLFTRLPMFSRIGPAALKPSLDNTLQLCGLVDNPQHRFKSIHIAGTNGKGSVSHMLAAILQSAGYKTGLYTSPHLKDFRERIKINGEWIAEDFITAFVERLQPAIEEVEPSFFEITVVMAFEYFAQQQVDIAVLETGLGGRLDSTNVVTPELSIITNIGLDHVQLLGGTLQAIAGEKAGIIKPAVPVVVGETDNETFPVFEKKAAEMDAPLYQADKTRWIADWHHQNLHLNINVAHSELADAQKHYQLDLPGVYQLKNVLAVLEAVAQLQAQGWKIEEQHIQHGLANVKKLTGLHGRWQVIQQQPQVVLEVAHNADGMRQVVQQLELSDYHQLHMVLGFVEDKDVDALLELLPKEATYYFTRAQIPRALPEKVLAEKAAAFGLSGESFATVHEAYTAALQQAQPTDLVLVCGSVFVVGEVPF